MKRRGSPVTNKKALIIGINKYPKNELRCCVNDAIEVGNLLERNEDGEMNFSVEKLIDSEATYSNMIKKIKNIFSGDSEIALLYFSGHGYDDKYDGRIVTYDYQDKDYGIKYADIVDIANKSGCKNKIIILDCCHSGMIGNFSMIGDKTILANGITILTACNTKEEALEIGEHGVFTNLLISALKGGASDIFGRITPGSIYSYIDSSLGDFDQRPLFKSNVSSFITLRKTKSKMSYNDIRSLHDLFNDIDYKYKLDPSYEPTNYKGSTEIGKKDNKEPYFTKENGEIFKLLQKSVYNGLVQPSIEKHLFYAAINSDTCELTMLGKYYWSLAENGII